MKLVFCRNNTIGSWLIRMFTWSPWSHCAILDGETIIDSTLLGGGVKERSLMSFFEHYTTIIVVDVPVPDEAAALAFAKAQVGKPYDWRALFGFVLRRDWKRDDAWFCNELAEASLLAGGRQRFRDAINRITPRESWMVI